MECLHTILLGPVKYLLINLIIDIILPGVDTKRFRIRINSIEIKKPITATRDTGGFTEILIVSGNCSYGDVAVSAVEAEYRLVLELGLLFCTGSYGRIRR